MIHRSMSNPALPKQSSAGEASPPSSPALHDILNDPHNQDISIENLKSLIKTSKAEHSLSIPDFVENGARAPNSDLRKVATLDSHNINKDTEDLLRDLYSQDDCKDRYAFRLYHARPEVAGKLSAPGTRIADFGVQSASIHLSNAENWVLDHPAEGTKRIIFVLDKNVPKKNISTNFLVDHVVVLPGEVLEISDCEERAGTTYVMLKAAGMQVDQPVYSSFDGSEYVNFHDKKAYFESFKKPGN